MFHIRFGRRLLIAAACSLAAATAACGSHAGPAHTIPCDAGQAELRPLEGLTLVTSKGRFDFLVEDANTDQARETGLMCRARVAADRGMLFDFIQPQDGVNFWMKNTIIPLDIVFIGPDGRIVSIARNAKPLDLTPLPARGVVRGVLELAGGRAAQLGLQPGDQVLHRIFPK